MHRLYKKYEEIIRYLLVGGMTTTVNFTIYTGAFLIIKGAYLDYQIANAISFMVAVVFAYFANRNFVFHSKAKGTIDIAREAGSFFLMRLASFGIEAALMALFVDVWKINEIVAKIPVMFFVIILNYIFSKLFIFKKTAGKGE